MTTIRELIDLLESLEKRVGSDIMVVQKSYHGGYDTIDGACIRAIVPWGGESQNYCGDHLSLEEAPLFDEDGNEVSINRHLAVCVGPNYMDS